jgi:CDP-glucose 4,6-dehydratase
MSRDFWKGKKVFLTGHTGFKGGWFALRLQRYGAELSGYALPPVHENGIYLATRVEDGLQSTVGDIRDAGRLRMAMAAAAPEIAFHFAAQPLVRASYVNPSETYDVNVMGTVNFLEAVRATSSVRIAVIITSDKCYDNREWPWGYRESDPMGGGDPYSSSKGCAELVTAAYRRSFFSDGRVAVATARAGNVIGGGDWADDRLVPDMARAWSCQRPLYVRFPGAIRPWQHVLEPLRGYMMLAERLWGNTRDFSEGWNFGPREEDAWPVGKLVARAAGLWGEGAAWKTDEDENPHEARFLKLDCSKARTELGWTPLLDLETTLTWTAAWYRAQQMAVTDMHAFTLQQIELYEGLVAAEDTKSFHPGADGE